MAVQHLDKLGVHPLREQRVPLKQRAYGLQVHLHGVAPEHHAVGVAHRHAGDLMFPPGHRNLPAHHALTCQVDRNLLRGQHGRAHIHRDRHGAAVLHHHFADLHPAFGVDMEHGLLGNAVVVQVLGHAAHPVAAHPALAAVGVENTHQPVGPLAGADEDDPIAPHALVPVREPHRQSGGVLYRLFKAVDIHVVVAAAVHFGEM